MLCGKTLRCLIVVFLWGLAWPSDEELKEYGVKKWYHRGEEEAEEVLL